MRLQISAYLKNPMVLERTNADEISRALHELQEMGGAAEELRERILDNNGLLQDSGGSFLSKLDAMQEAMAAQRNLSQARQVRPQDLTPTALFWPPG